MTDFVPVDFGKPLEDIIEQMAERNADAAKALKHIAATLIERRAPLMPTLYDLDDMQMRGAQIANAWACCTDHAAEAGNDPDEVVEFVARCSERNADMVDYVNARVSGRPVRRHGPQRTVSQIDQAVAAATSRVGPDASMERLDEDAEAIHRYFINLFSRMQSQREFVANHHVNTGMEGIGMITFAITVCEIKDAQGSVLWSLPTESVKTPSVQ